MINRISILAIAAAVGLASALTGAVLPQTSFASTSQTYTYVGAPQIYVVPDGVTSVVVTLKGAQGLSVTSGGTGGEGATLSATISVSPGEVLQVNIGGQGLSNASAYNGGGRPGGGGATDIRRPTFASTMTTFNSCAYNFSCGYSERIVVAGGGGGGGNLAGSNGGRGGENGEVGSAFNEGAGNATGGAGGSQSAGGSAGSGTVSGGSSAGPGSGSVGVGGANGWATGAFGGGGGGGYFGGGQGGQSSNGVGGNLGAGGGGGGSSYAGGVGVSSPSFTTGGGTGNGTLVISESTAISDASFGYTGAAQMYTVAAGVTELAVRINGGVGTAQGDVVYGRLPVSGGQILQVNIGGATIPVSEFNGVFSGGSGGWNGGGSVTGAGPLSTTGTTGGGGASDIRVSPYGLEDRIVVAGGGGGCYSFWCPGNGWTVGSGGKDADGTGGNAFRNSGEGVFTGGSLTAGGLWMNNTTTPWTVDTSMPTAAGGQFGQGGSDSSGGGGGYYGGAAANAAGGGSSYASVTGPDASMQGVGNVLGQTGAAFQHDRGGSSGDGIAVMTAMPSASTDPASAITGTNAAISGTVRPRFLASKPAVFYSTSQTTVNDGGGTVEYLTGPASATILAGDSTQAVSGSLTGLSRGTTYYYRVCARSVAGNGCGETRSFTTDPRLEYNGNSPTTGSAPASVDAVSGTSIVVSANTGSLEKTGSLFNGWNTESNGTGITYQPGTSITLTANTTLHARWTTTASITYQGNGSTGGSAAASGTYSVGGPAYTVEANSFTRSGYSFTGWNTSTVGAGTAFAPGASMTPSADVILFAQWSATGSSGGGGTPAPLPSPSTPTVPSPVVITPPLSPILVEPTISVRPGQAVALANGQLQDVSVSTQGNSAQVSGPQWSVQVRTPSVSARPTEELTARSGGVMQVNGNGYVPGTQVLIYVLGVDQPIGTATVGADGAFATSATLPANLVRSVVLQVNGYATSISVRSVSLGVKLTGKPKRAQRIVMGSVLFDIFSPVLKPKAKKTLRAIARSIGSRPAKISTIGYTQGIGVLSSALKLSKERAEVVNEFLRTKGVQGPQRAQGVGNRGPKDADRTAVVTVRYLLAAPTRQT